MQSSYLSPGSGSESDRSAGADTVQDPVLVDRINPRFLLKQPKVSNPEVCFHLFLPHFAS